MAPSAEQLKAQGNEAYRAGDNAGALAAYESAIAAAAGEDAEDAAAILPILHSNASAAAARLEGKAQLALEHAQRAVEMKPAWAKGYVRQAAASLLLHRPGDAERALRQGLRKASGDGEQMLRLELDKILEVGGCCRHNGGVLRRGGAAHPAGRPCPPACLPCRRSLPAGRRRPAAAAGHHARQPSPADARPAEPVWAADARPRRAGQPAQRRLPPRLPGQRGRVQVNAGGAHACSLEQFTRRSLACEGLALQRPRPLSAPRPRAAAAPLPGAQGLLRARQGPLPARLGAAPAPHLCHRVGCGAGACPYSACLPSLPCPGFVARQPWLHLLHSRPWPPCLASISGAQRVDHVKDRPVGGGHAAILRAVCEAGARVDARDVAGYTALMRECLAGAGRPAACVSSCLPSIPPPALSPSAPCRRGGAPPPAGPRPSAARVWRRPQPAHAVRSGGGRGRGALATASAGVGGQALWLQPCPVLAPDLLRRDSAPPRPAPRPCAAWAACRCSTPSWRRSLRRWSCCWSELRCAALLCCSLLCRTLSCCHTGCVCLPTRGRRGDVPPPPAHACMRTAHPPCTPPACSAGADPNARDFDGISVEDVARHFPAALALVHKAQASPPLPRAAAAAAARLSAPPRPRL